MNHADRVRQELGLSPGSAVPAGPGTERFSLRDVVARSRPKTAEPVQGLGRLASWSWVALAMTGLVAASHVWITSSLAGSSNALSRFVLGVLTFAAADVWLPWAAGAVGVGLVVMAFLTRGFTRADAGQIVTLTVMDVTSMLLALPVAIAIAVGVMVIVFYVVVFGLVVAVLIAGLASLAE